MYEIAKVSDNIEYSFTPINEDKYHKKEEAQVYLIEFYLFSMIHYHGIILKLLANQPLSFNSVISILIAIYSTIFLSISKIGFTNALTQ